MESVQQQSFPITEARVITQATRPQRKSSPKLISDLWRLRRWCGLILGLGLGMLRDISDRVFRTSKQVEDQLKTECMAILPMIKSESELAFVGNKAAGHRAAERTIEPPSLLRYDSPPLSRSAGSMRAVKVGAGLDNVTKSNRVIGIASSAADTGKAAKDRAGRAIDRSQRAQFAT